MGWAGRAEGRRRADRADRAGRTPGACRAAGTRGCDNDFDITLDRSRAFPSSVLPPRAPYAVLCLLTAMASSMASGIK